MAKCRNHAKLGVWRHPSTAAGFGKTTLVTEWLGQREWPVAWVALDEDDSESQQFFSYLALAVAKIDGVGQSLAGYLQAPQAIPAKPLMMAFVGDITSATAPFLVIVHGFFDELLHTGQIMQLKRSFAVHKLP